MLSPVKNIINLPSIFSIRNSINVTLNREQSLNNITSFIYISMITSKCECKTRNSKTCKCFSFSINTPIYRYRIKMSNKQTITCSIFFMEFKTINCMTTVINTSTIYFLCSTICNYCCTFFFICHNLIKFYCLKIEFKKGN